MAYRRKQGMQRSNTFVEDHSHPSPGDSASPATASPRATRFADDSRRPDRSLAAQTVVASAARGDVPALAERFPASASSSSASPRAREVSPSPRGTRVSPRRTHASPRGRQVSPLAVRPVDPTSSPRKSPHAGGRSNDPFAQDPVTMLYTSTTTGANDDSKRSSPLKRDEAKQGLWGLLAQQGKVMLDECGSPREGARNLAAATSGGSQQSKSPSRWSYDRVRKSESPTFGKGSKLDIGGHIKNALEESLQASMAENMTAAGRKLQIRRKTCSVDMRGANMTLASSEVMSPMHTDFESPQIKASRDVANVMAAKVKLLQRELKTVKADLAFSKERCAQLEEENRLLRDGNHDHAADEDLIRQQLETLLGEKARLSNENSVYSRENRFLREFVDLNQLNMVGLQEDIIEEEEEEEVDDNAEQPLSSSPLCVVQEEPDDDDMPDTPGTAPPQSPSHHPDIILATASQSPRHRTGNDVPAAAPHTPSRRTDNVTAESRTDSGDAPHTPSRPTDDVPAASRTDSSDAPLTPSRRTDNVPVASATDSSDAPHTPSRRTDNVPVASRTDSSDDPHTPSRRTDNVPAASPSKTDSSDAPHTPSRRTDNVPAASKTDSSDANIHASESPMQRKPQEDGGSLQTSIDTDCSPEKGRQ